LLGWKMQDGKMQDFQRRLCAPSEAVSLIDSRVTHPNLFFPWDEVSIWITVAWTNCHTIMPISHAALARL